MLSLHQHTSDISLRMSSRSTITTTLQKYQASRIDAGLTTAEEESANVNKLKDITLYVNVVRNGLNTPQGGSMSSLTLSNRKQRVRLSLSLYLHLVCSLALSLSEHIYKQTCVLVQYYKHHLSEMTQSLCWYNIDLCCTLSSL